MEGNRGTGLGFTSNVEDKRKGLDPLWTCRMFGRKPPCRAMLALASRFRYACSATPIKRLIDQMNRFVPPSGIEPASTVLQTVALPFKPQRRMPSRRGDVATRLPIRRHLHRPFASRHGVAISTAFATWMMVFYARSTRMF